MDLVKPGWLGLVVSGVGQCHLGAVPLNCRACCLKTFGIVLQQHVGERSWPCQQEGGGGRNLSWPEAHLDSPVFLAACTLGAGASIPWEHREVPSPGTSWAGWAVSGIADQ